MALLPGRCKLAQEYSQYQRPQNLHMQDVIAKISMEEVITSEAQGVKRGLVSHQ